MCDDCYESAINDAIDEGARANAAERRAEALEQDLAEVRRVAAKWMRKALGPPKGGRRA